MSTSWCGIAQQAAAENNGCTCPQPWKGTPQPHAGYCWLVSPPRSEVDEMRKRIAELSQQRDDLLAETVTMLEEPDDTLQQLRDRAEKAEARIAASLAWHVKFPDSEHCQHDSEPWPCPTVKALQP